MKDLKRADAHLLKASEDLLEAISLFEAGFTDGTCNRAYYALFHCILALLHTENGPIPKTHTGAHTEFRKHFIKGGTFDESFSGSISELFNMRQGGDYDIEFDISIEDAESAVELATVFLQKTKDHIHLLSANS